MYTDVSATIAGVRRVGLLTHEMRTVAAELDP
jgi:hypothetical protein